MKCPHCDYENNYYKNYENDESEFGPFYKLELSLKRKYKQGYCGYAESGSKELIGCPKCNKTFID